ncbi:CarD family transcriptional regulator [Bradyrhizobium sp. SZCCHNPS2010]|uniref:CarD family transcriptional regulator n=1 Tax=Bradyrhizobium sp. SZCCHNPS2010 TaxID=3057333 RepID=UPI0029165AED|nr:CarD family transcriptional regulator [Bradyrhizobium sp. SZCCHNPS2010]
MVFSWTRQRIEIPPGMVQLTSQPLDDWGEPVWNDEIEAKTISRGTDFLAPFMVEVSPGMCSGGYLVKAQYRSPVRSYAACAVMMTRKNDELQTTVLINAPACLRDGREWTAHTQRLTASLPKEHLANMVHTLRGLCEQAHAQELLKIGSKPQPTFEPKEAKVSSPVRERNGFAVNEFIVYPAHGVGQIIAIESQAIAGAELELFVINFGEERMTLRVPTAKVTNVGMRKISTPAQIDAALSTLAGYDDDLREQTIELVARIESGDILELARLLREIRPGLGREEMYKTVLERFTKEIAISRGLQIEAVLSEIERQFSRSSADRA